MKLKQKLYVTVDSQRNIQFSTMKEASLSIRPIVVLITKNIIENRKKDICVTDSRARAVVVVIYAEKLGFSYTGFFLYNYQNICK